MAAGDEIRHTIQNTRELAKQYRVQIAHMRQSSSDLERMAAQLDAEIKRLEKQAKDVDSTEQRAKVTMQHLGNPTP